MNRSLLRLALVWLAFTLMAAGQRQLESLGRGVVAVRTGTSAAHVSWRLLGNDRADVAFNLYRSSGGGAAVKLNTSPLTATTDYQDSSANFAASVSYHVRPVINGLEQPPSASFTLPPGAATRQYLEIPLQIPPGGTSPDSQAYTYTANDASSGDLDGDGEYELVLRWEPTNSWGGGSGGHTGPVLLDAYKLDGTRLWRINLGTNINAGSHITQFVVYDLDGDGKSELACMTADGTIDGTGAILGDGLVDYHNSSGVVLSGPEFLTIFNGQTGAAMTSTLFVPQRHPATQFPTAQQIEDVWGDGYGNRVNRFLAGVAYVDGQRPSLIFARGYYTRTVISAWDWRNATLTKRWTFDSDDGTPGNSAYRGQGAHSLSIGDLDGDGRDEVSYGACAIDDDGTGLWSSGLGHGDATHLSDMDLDLPGLEFFMPHEDPGSYGPYGSGMMRAETGEVIWGLSGNGGDIGRGVAFDIDPNHPGFEMWAANSGLVFTSRGDPIPTTTRPSYNFGVWWDADLGRELLDQNRIDKWVPASGNTTRLLTASGASSANGTKATPALSADLFGDWREEVVLRASDESALRIYTTTIPATNRLYTLMHDPQYRVAIAWQNSGYNQPPHPGFYLGYDMPAVPRSPIWNGDLVWKGDLNSNAFDAATANFKPTPTDTGSAVFENGKSVLFDGSGNSASAIALAGTLSPSAIVVHNAEGHDYTFSGSGNLAGGMALTKSGPGSLFIAGTHPFTGTTLVNQGTLNLTGTLTSTPLTLQGYGTLKGTGTLGAGLTSEPRGTISPGINGVGTLNVTGTTSLQSAAIDLDVASTPGGNHDRLAITGNLTLTGSTTLRLHPLGATPTPGIYTLITYTGTLTGGIGNLSYEGLVGLPATLAITAGAIVLEVTATRAPTAITWRGTGNVWDLYQSENWLHAGNPATFVTGDTVTFDATGAAAATVTLNDTLVPGSVTIDGATNYTFTGAGGIGGSGGLTKTGPGTLTLSSVNSHTGPTSLSGGIVNFSTLSISGDPGPFGSATSSPSNLVLTDTTLRFTGTSGTTDRGATISGTGVTFEVPSAASTVILLGNSTGAGAITKTGAGTLTLSGTNTHGGGTLISAGTIRLGNDLANQSALGSGIVTLAGGTLAMNNSESGGGDLSSWPISVPAGFTGRLNVDGRCTLGGALTGGGTFTFHTAFVRTDVTGNWSNFAGQINVITDGDGGEFRVANTAGMPNARVDLTGSINMISRATAGATIPIGNLSGNATSFISAGSGSGAAQQNAVTWRIGGLGLDGTYAGTIQGSTNLIKEGAGMLTLSGTNTHTGSTTVSGGILRVSGSTNGSNITVQIGGTLTGGGSVTGNVTVQSGGTLAFGLTPTANESLQITGNLSVSGELLVSSRLLGGSLAPGTYPLLSYTGTLSGNPTFVWSSPPGTNFNGTFLHTAPSGGNPGTITVTLVTPPRSPAEILWTGTTGGTWNHSILNWTYLGSPDIFKTGDTARFDETGSNAVPVSLTGDLQPAAVVVDAAKDYQFAGTGIISGTATLEKKGGGILTVSASHDFSGGSTIRGGTLVISSATSLGSGPVTLAGGTWATGALTPNNPVIVTADSIITGGHTGGNHGIKAVSGNSVLTLTATNVFDLEGSLASFSGRVVLNGSGSFRFFGGSGSANAAFDLGNRSLTARSGTAFSLGSLEGAAGSVLQGASGTGNTSAVTYAIGGNHSDSTFAGALSSGSGITSIVKSGTGNLTLAGTSTLNGPITVDSGKLTVTGSTSTTSSAQINHGATLAIEGGTSAAATTNVAGSLGGYGTLASNLTCAGTFTGRGFSSGTPGTLDIAGNAVFGSTSLVRLRGGVSSDRIATTGDLSLAGTVQISLAPGTTFGRYPLFTCGGILTLGSVTLTGIPPGTTAHLSISIAGRADLVIDDSDEDNLPDSWEQTNFQTLAQTPSGDMDGDGTTNLVELRLNLDPSSGSSAFRATCSGHFLNWPSAPGIVFTVKRSLTLDGGNWQTLGTITGGAGTTATYTDSESLEKAFYRIEFAP